MHLRIQGSNSFISRRAGFYGHHALGFSNMLFSSAMDKLTETGENSRFVYGLADMQGWRISEFSSSTMQIFCMPMFCMKR